MDEEIDEGQELKTIVGEMAEDVDDLELAWQNLDICRLILSKQVDSEDIAVSVPAKRKLADVHLVLGDVSLESGTLSIMFC